MKSKKCIALIVITTLIMQPTNFITTVYADVVKKGNVDEQKVITDESIAISNESIIVDDFIFDENEKKVIGYVGKETVINIPNMINGIKVEKIGEYAFSNNETITSVNIKSSVVKVERGAFKNCINLEKIDIARSVESIGSEAFYNCKNLNTVVLNEGLKRIEDSSYNSRGAFEECISLKEVIIPSTVELIGSDAFSGCIELTKANIKNGLIESRAFRNNKKLSELTLGDGVTGIGSYAFENCEKIQKLLVPNKVTFIGSGAFDNCISLESVKMGEKIERIGTKSFRNCKSLKIVEFNEGLKEIEDSYYSGEGAFQNCISLKSIILPDSIENVGREAFAGCSSINEVKILSIDPIISRSAFRDCIKLNNLILSKHSKIDNLAFSNCNSLRVVRISRDADSEDINIVKETFLNGGFDINKIEFIAVNDVEDVNNYGIIDIKDIATIAKVYNIKQGISGFKNILDINGDDIIDIYDLINVSKKV